MDFHGIVEELNYLSPDYRVGELQQLRVDIRGSGRKESGMRLRVPINADPAYAFHWGGRKELQFNVGIEDDDTYTSRQQLRYGVAFSFEPGRPPNSIQEVRSSLIPQVDRFNEYMRWNSETFANLTMWDWSDGVKSKQRCPGTVYPNPPCDGQFIFMGKTCTLDHWNPKEVLKTFDELLPLYEYVQSDGASSLKPISRQETGFSFRSGCGHRQGRATGERDPGPYDIRLRHNNMQFRLYKKLVSMYGEKSVGTEIRSGNGMYIDLVVRQKADSFIFYEIKTAREPRICIREALGQLLEYAYWGDRAREPTGLVVVGQSPIDKQGQEYLNKVRQRCGLSIEYYHLESAAAVLT